jgi:hypothetical protein
VYVGTERVREFLTTFKVENIGHEEGEFVELQADTGSGVQKKFEPKLG